MSRLIVRGGKRLSGSVRISGAKNSVLPIISAALLCKGKTVIKNCPIISDVLVCIEILKELGVKAELRDNTLTVESDRLNGFTVPGHLMNKMRSSVIFSGSLLSRTGRAVISTPGGCELGPRPIDLHIKSLEALGASYIEKHGLLEFNAPKGLKGNIINLPIVSVGVTENIILASVLAKGKTVINNAAREPEITDLARFLNSAGAKISGTGTSTVTVEGVKELSAVEYSVMPDRIETATFMSAAAITGGEITLSGTNANHLTAVISAFRMMGCDISGQSEIRFSAPKRLKALPYIKSLVYPNFPTDAGPILISALTKARGTSVFVETVFENRYRFIPEISRLGAKIKTEGKVAIIDGAENLYGAPCACTDLRGGAATVIAALGAEGESIIDNVEYIYRGYENFGLKLKSLGADVYTEE